MKDDVRMRTLLIEAHSIIASESRRAATRVGVPLRAKPRAIDPTRLDDIKPGLVDLIASSISQHTLNYPPENRPLTPAEESALQNLELTRVQRSALRKLIADACAATMFQFLCIMDGVGHPYATPTKHWQGASFAARKEGPLLHDEFGALYWEYKRSLTPEPSSKKKPKRVTRRRPRRAT
jgi:hypothetical protein